MSRLLPIFCLLLWSCEKHSDHQFWIAETTEHRNDFLFMVESTNIAQTKADSLRLFLTKDEFYATKLGESEIFPEETHLPKPVSFKKIQSLKTNGNYRALVLLRIGDEANRNYRFLVRTYSMEWDIIDSYEFAVWNQNKSEFCYGSIDAKIIIEKICDGSSTTEIARINERGEISETSSDE